MLYTVMRYEDLIENVTTYRATVADNLLPELLLSFVTLLLLLYVRGMVRAYRAAGDGWKRMDRDVRMVFLSALAAGAGTRSLKTSRSLAWPCDETLAYGEFRAVQNFFGGR